MAEKKKTMTTDAGRPVGDNQNSLTVGPRGPVVFEDVLLFEKMAHFNRERIPERVVHAKGSGAYGHFVCASREIAKYTTAKLFSQVGKKTPTFIRFSTVGGEKGSADTERDPRGFALKFYTEEGNWDMTGNNTPVFFIRDWNLEKKKKLIRKAYEAVADGGALIVYDSIIDDDRSLNAFGLLMSLNMLIETPGGFDYTGTECMELMREAGFRETRVEPLVGPDSMVIGIK
jgi:hypothetical protein